MTNHPNRSRRIPLHPTITVDRIVEACEADDYLGFCKACGADAMNVEPDACNYPCESCGAKQVFGAQELLLENVA